MVNIANTAEESIFFLDRRDFRISIRFMNSEECHMNELNKKSHIIQCSAAQINTTVQ